MKILSLVFVLVILSVFLYEFIALEREGYDNKATNYSQLANTGQLSAADNKKALNFSASSVNYIPPKTNTPDIKYNKDPLQVANIQYHPSEEEILADATTNITTSKIYVKDQSGNTVAMSVPTVSSPENILYYTPGSYPFGASSYVPNYEDSVFMSKLTGASTASPIQNPFGGSTGFCDKYKNDPYQLEEQCKSTDLEKCASTNCCVLLGGSKCVSGNEQGPINQTNYGDAYLHNRDFYYYQGKCYGNCTPDTNSASRLATAQIKPSNSSALISISSIANVSSAGLSISQN